LLHKWRAKGIKCLGYIDDFLFAGPSAEALRRALHEVILPDLQSAGMVVSWQKCNLVPAQRQSYLGVEIDTSGDGTMRIPGPKAADLMEKVHGLLSSTTPGGTMLARP
jgi:hypothetical protein